MYAFFAVQRIREATEAHDDAHHAHRHAASTVNAVNRAMDQLYGLKLKLSKSLGRKFTLIDGYITIVAYLWVMVVSFDYAEAVFDHMCVFAVACKIGAGVWCSKSNAFLHPVAIDITNDWRASIIIMVYILNWLIQIVCHEFWYNAEMYAMRSAVTIVYLRTIMFGWDYAKSHELGMSICIPMPTINPISCLYLLQQIRFDRIL